MPNQGRVVVESRVRSNAIFCMAASLSGHPKRNPKVDVLFENNDSLIFETFANSDDGTGHVKGRLGYADLMKVGCQIWARSHLRLRIASSQNWKPEIPLH